MISVCWFVCPNYRKYTRNANKFLDVIDIWPSTNPVLSGTPIIVSLFTGTVKIYRYITACGKNMFQMNFEHVTPCQT